MKADAPEKIYIFKDELQKEDHNVIYGVNQDRNIEGLVEYARTDTFVEKSCDAYCKVCKMPNCRSNECKFISEFKRHLEIM